MEKKKYVAPKITVIEIDSESILAGSSLRVAGDDEGNFSEDERWGD